MAYTIGQIESIAAKLRELPRIERKRRQINKREAVALLAKEIKLMQQRGYTLEQITDALRGERFDITTPVLKNYLQRAKAIKNKAAPPASIRASGVSGHDTADAAIPDTLDSCVER